MKKPLWIAWLLLICFLPALAVDPSPDPRLQKLLEDGEKLFMTGKHAEALMMINEGLEKYPQWRLQLISVRMNVYDNLGRFAEAAADASERDRLDNNKKPRFAFDVAYEYLRLGDLDNTFIWLERSVDRGFQTYNIFDKYDEFRPLRGDKRLEALIRRIKENAGIGKAIKPFTCLDLAGRKTSPAVYLGKVLLIDFWATWCPPCVKEIPVLKECYESYHGQGFEIIGISLDQDRAKLDAFMKEKQINWPVSCSLKGFVDDDIRQSYGVESIPSSWLVDKKGNLRHLGLRGDQLKQAVAELLKE